MKNFRYRKTVRTVTESKTVHDIMAQTADEALAKLTEKSGAAQYNNGTASREGGWVVIGGDTNYDKTVSIDEDYELIED